MKLRYFVVDTRGQLRRVPKAAIRSLWQGRLRANALGCVAGKELRLVSALCDEKLLPKKMYVLRLPLIDGVCTEESRMTLHLFSRPDCVTPAELAEHHMEGWPRSFFKQLAVALDVPLAALQVPLGVGGPLFVAAALQVTPREALRYLR